MYSPLAWSFLPPGFHPSWSSLCVWDFVLVQVYARVDFYLFSTVTKGRLVRKPFGYYVLCYNWLLYCSLGVRNNTHEQKNSLSTIRKHLLCRNSTNRWSTRVKPSGKKYHHGGANRRSMRHGFCISCSLPPAASAERVDCSGTNQKTRRAYDSSFGGCFVNGASPCCWVR